MRERDKRGSGVVVVVLVGGGYMDMEDCLQEQPQGLEFPTPGVVLLFGLHLASSASHGRTSAIQ